jgi:hypothetical protein
MPPLSTLSDAEIQFLNGPPKSVKRAQLASLCRKASLKIKGTVSTHSESLIQNADLIAALNATVHSDVATDQENQDPSASRFGKDLNNPDPPETVLLDDESEKSVETVIHYNVRPNRWSESTPAVSSLGRSKLRRSMAKRKRTGGVYPDLSIIEDGAPTTSTEDFGKIADGILEEMNARLAGTLPPSLTLMAAKQSLVKPADTPSAKPIFKDTVVVPIIESPSFSGSNKRRFSNVHNKIFHKYFFPSDHLILEWIQLKPTTQLNAILPRQQNNPISSPPWAFQNDATQTLDPPKSVASE